MIKFHSFGNQKPTVLVFMHLIQDLDIMLPLLLGIKNRDDIVAKVCVLDWLLKQSPRVERTLKSLDIKFFSVSRLGVLTGLEPSLRGTHGLITASESTADAHKAAYALTERANKAGLYTYTLQHGFENIGLTYFDPVHSAEEIGFASQKILIWGDTSLLPPQVPPDTKLRCVTVGCLKEVITKNNTSTKVEIPKPREYLIAIFENLHWHRYNEEYKQRFLNDIEQTALQFPNTTFLIKPHHAGQWLTKDYKGALPCGDNIVIGDPKDPKWEPFTAPVLIQNAHGVITTPSTVTLDAARIDCPVSVVSYGLDIVNYAPLPIINTLEDWANFVKQLQSPEGSRELIAQANLFVSRNIIPGDAVKRILDLITTDISGKTISLVTNNPTAYPSEVALRFLEELPLEYKFRGMNSEHLFNRLKTERGLFVGDAIDASAKQKSISLIVLVDRKPSTELATTLKSWELQSCPLTHCLLIPLESNSAKCLDAWLEEQDLDCEIRICKDTADIQKLQLNEISDFVLFARPGDIIAPTLATRLKLIALSENPDIIVWNLQQLSINKGNGWKVEEFLRRPQLERHTIRHLNYISTTFAVKPSLASTYPFNLFEHIIHNDAHLFHIWLANQVHIKWHTHPEYLTLRCYENKPADFRNLIKPFVNTYQELFQQIEQDFDFELQVDEQLPYKLKPHYQAHSISVIIPFRDKADETCNCLDSVFNQQIAGKLEVILVNNQSTENSLKQIKKHIDNHQKQSLIKLINYDFPFNHSRQCNLGVKAGDGEVIVFLNNDAEIVSEFTLEEMAAWALLPGLATVGCQISSSDGRYLCAGIKARAVASPKNVTFVAESVDTKYANVIRETYGNTFACAAIARATYHQIGGLDEREFFNGFNDVEFLLRSRQAGYTNIYLGHLQVKHLPGTSRGRCDELTHSIILRQRFPQAAVDGLFQLEQDEYLMEKLLKYDPKHDKGNNVNIQLSGKEQVYLNSINKLKIEIQAMKTSKFWKIREKWLKIKKILGM
ncbi:MAG: glycosyltransferase [Goleter apudmare HA4340-LM2]|nr:glycosyltransferase [Goleter apudmare HA4340-LM2]